MCSLQRAYMSGKLCQRCKASQLWRVHTPIGCLLQLKAELYSPRLQRCAVPDLHAWLPTSLGGRFPGLGQRPLLLAGRDDVTPAHVRKISHIRHCLICTASCPCMTLCTRADRWVSNFNAEDTKHVSSALTTSGPPTFAIHRHFDVIYHCYGSR